MDPCVQHGEHGIMFTTLKVTRGIICRNLLFPVRCSEGNVGAQRNMGKLNLSSFEFQVFMCLSPTGMLLPDPTREDHVGLAPPSQASD